MVKLRLFVAYNDFYREWRRDSVRLWRFYIRKLRSERDRLRRVQWEFSPRVFLYHKMSL